MCNEYLRDKTPKQLALEFCGVRVPVTFGGYAQPPTRTERKDHGSGAPRPPGSATMPNAVGYAAAASFPGRPI